MLLGPKQKRPRQIHLTGWQEDTLAPATGILEVEQDETVASDIHRPQGERFTDARTSRPQHSQQVTATMTPSMLTTSHAERHAHAYPSQLRVTA
jgi:hypothetical protein